MKKNEEKLLDCQKLKKVYQTDLVKTVALKEATLSIEKGEFVAIMGASGSGKSTLLHILGLLDRPTSGAYFFNGRSIDDYDDDELAQIRNEEIGFVFQKFNLLRKASVYENVLMPLYYSSIHPSKWKGLVLDAIESVGLTERLSHFSGQLSGGEQQRVAIARAIVNKPQIIFADEPTGNLDSKSGGIIMEIIRDLNKQGSTVVLITHEAYTSSYARRIITLKDGEILSDRKQRTNHKKKEDYHK